jgi:sarcosine oxidase subunit beta
LFERFSEEVGYPIDLHQDGYLFLLSTEESLAGFRANVEMQRGLGIEVDLLAPKEAERLAPGINVQGVTGATFCARDGIADPNGVTMGFGKAAQAAGVVLCRETEVTDIDAAGGRVRAVTTTRGVIQTPVVVNAAGPWAGRIGKMVGLEVPVRPYRRHIFITEAVSSEVRVPTSRIMVIDFETTFYFHREGAGVLFGMGDPDEPSSFNTTVSWELLEKVTPVAMRRLPILGEVGIARAWAGLYEMTPDAMPIIGPAPGVEGFYVIAGFSGHGFQHSPAAGRILADIIATGRAPDTQTTQFALERFSSESGQGEAAVV